MSSVVRNCNVKIPPGFPESQTSRRKVRHNCGQCGSSQSTFGKKASNEEILIIKDAVSVSVPEKFLLEISELTVRISCIVFQEEFEERVEMITKHLMTLESVSKFLLEEESLKIVFSIILTLVNIMNGGNQQRGQADGFGLDILGKLKDVKSKDSKLSLLEFIVTTHIKRSRKSGVAIAELKVLNPDDVEKSLSVDFVEYRAEVKTLKTRVVETEGFFTYI